MMAGSYSLYASDDGNTLRSCRRKIQFNAPSLRVSQSRPSKNGCSTKSWIPFCPSLPGGEVIRRHIRSLASSDTSSTSSGNRRLF